MSRPSTSISTTLRRRGLREEAATATVDQACRRLRLPTIRAVVADAASAAHKEQLSYYGFLAERLLSECDDRDRRSVVRRIKGSGFPREKWLSEFDFDAPPHINPATVGTLATGDSIRKGQPLCLIGTPEPVNRICSSDSALRPSGTVAASNTSSPRDW